MFNAVSKAIIVAVVFVAFIGQTMALSMVTPCDSSLDAKYADVTERIEHKEIASIVPEIAAHCCDVDCCDLDCICIANACSSIVYLPVFWGVTSTFVLTELIYNPTSEQPNAFTSLLYRPPIFA